MFLMPLHEFRAGQTQTTKVAEIKTLEGELNSKANLQASVMSNS